MCLFDVGAGRFSLVFAFGVELLALRLCRVACGIVCFHVGISFFFLALRFSRWPLAMVFCFSFRVVFLCLPTNFLVGFQRLASAQRWAFVVWLLAGVGILGLGVLTFPEPRLRALDKSR